jgi:chromosome segregation ATPase
MVKKEEIQKELEMRKQENKDLQKHIGELIAENEELKKELEEAKKAAEEAKTRTETDRNGSERIGTENADGGAETRDPEAEDAANGQADGQDIELKGKIGILLGAIAESCKDHCPHHLNPDACKNCSIKKAVFNAGFDMPKPMTETEKE